MGEIGTGDQPRSLIPMLSSQTKLFEANQRQTKGPVQGAQVLKDGAGFGGWTPAPTLLSSWLAEPAFIAVM